MQKIKNRYADNYLHLNYGSIRFVIILGIIAIKRLGTYPVFDGENRCTVIRQNLIAEENENLKQ